MHQPGQITVSGQPSCVIFYIEDNWKSQSQGQAITYYKFGDCARCKGEGLS